MQSIKHFLFVCFLLLAGSAFATPTLVQQNRCNRASGNAGCGVAFGSTVALNDIIICAQQVSNGTASLTSPAPCTDTIGNTFIAIGTSCNSAGTPSGYVYYAINKTATTDTVTMGDGALSAGDQDMHIADVSGLLTSSVVDTSIGTSGLVCASGTSANPASGSATPATANEFAFAMTRVNAASTFTNGASWSTVENIGNSYASEYQVVSGSVNGSWTGTGSGAWDAVMVMFKSTAGGSSVSNAHSLIM